MTDGRNMLFPEEHASHLKKWIVKRLENTSDADADVLADYVLALLRHDGDANDVRKLCEAEIPDFLKEDSSVFVNDVFEAITYKSYMPGAPPPPSKRPKPVVQHQLPPQLPQIPQLPVQLPPGGGLIYDDVPSIPQLQHAFQQQQQQQQQQNGGFNSSRKRGYNDMDNMQQQQQQNGRDSGGSGRAYKQPRRGGRSGGAGADGNVRGGGGGGRGGGGAGAATATLPATPFSSTLPAGAGAGAAPFDIPNNITMETLLGLAASGGGGVAGRGGNSWSFPNLAAAAAAPQAQQTQQARGGGGSRRRPRCRDYDTKGYCSRGNTCMFEHGDDSIYLPTPHPFSSPPTGAGPAVAVLPTQQQSQQQIEEYDPSNALIGAAAGGFPAPFQFPHLLSGMDQNNNFARGGGRRGHKGGGQQNKRRGRAPFSADGPVFDRTKSTIVVESIPEEKFNEEEVRSFFGQFGNILEVNMQPYKRLAIVKFDSWGAANAAYKSPKVVFDNRFVKVFWYKDDHADLPKNSNGAGANGHTKSTSASGQSATGGNGGSPAPEIDMDKFIRKQAEAQNAYEEKRKKLEEVEQQRQELERRQKELLAKQAEEKARLEAKLKKLPPPGQNGNKAEEEEGKPKSQTEALRAQLAALEAEAKQLGLDPEAIEEDTWGSWYPGRGGGYRGRGRGAFRARGYAPRGGYRGGAPFRGRGGYPGAGAGTNVHAAYAAYSLDNRPKKIALTGVDLSLSERDETLRQYLFGIGEFTDIQSTSSSTEITFKDRKTAEKFFFGLAQNDKRIPGIEGQLEAAWVGGGGSSSAANSTVGSPAPTYTSKPAASFSKPPFNLGPKAQKAANGVVDGDTEMGGGDGDRNIDEPPQTLETGDADAGGNNMDYDVADENQWDIE